MSTVIFTKGRLSPRVSYLSPEPGVSHGTLTLVHCGRLRGVRCHESVPRIGHSVLPTALNGRNNFGGRPRQLPLNCRADAVKRDDTTLSSAIDESRRDSNDERGLIKRKDRCT